MGKQKQSKDRMFKGLNGTEIKYLKDSIKYGHLSDAGSTSKQSYKYKK